MKYLTLFLLLFSMQLAFSQENLVKEENLSIDQFTDGTLSLPENAEAKSLVIFIQGSGPVNRDGNAP